MSTVVTGVISQPTTITYQTYKPSEQNGNKACSCGHCSINTQLVPCTNGDYAYDTTSCCSGFCARQLLCTRPAPNICTGAVSYSQSLQPLAGAFENVQWTTPDTVGNKYTPANINCNYDATKITTQAQINAWAQNFGSTGQQWNTIMTNFCSLQETQCPIDPNTGQAMTSCSRIIANTTEGNSCRQWCNQDAGDCNTSMNNYCQKYPTSVDCGCIQRQQNPLYVTIVGGLGTQTPPGCWYLPCTGDFPGSTYLTPSTVVPQPGTCPQNICSQITNILNNTNTPININQLNQTTDCPYNQTNIGGGFWQQYKWWIIAALIVVGVFFALLILLAFFVHEHGKNKDQVATPVAVTPNS